MADVATQRTAFENAYQPALKYFEPEQLPSILSATLPPPSIEGQFIEFFVWLNPYFKSHTITAIAVRLDGELFWAYQSIPYEVWHRRKIMT